MANEMTVGGLIRDLQSLIERDKLNADSLVWIGESYCHSHHRYQVGSWMTTKIEEQVGPGHTCQSSDCTCPNSSMEVDDETAGNDPNCPFCYCPGCEFEDSHELQVNDLYLMMGDQSQLPDELQDVED